MLAEIFKYVTFTVFDLKLGEMILVCASVCLTFKQYCDNINNGDRFGQYTQMYIF